MTIVEKSADICPVRSSRRRLCDARLAPSARSLRPETAIDDRALMLCFLCLIAAVTTIAMSIPVDRVVEIAERHPVGRAIAARISRTAAGVPAAKTTNGRARTADPTVTDELR